MFFLNFFTLENKSYFLKKKIGKKSEYFSGFFKINFSDILKIKSDVAN